MNTQYETWIQKYIRAWETNDPDDIGQLFTDDARYSTAPFREPWTGREGIVKGWLNRKDAPDTYTFRYEILGVTGDGETGFVRGWTQYLKPPRTFSNLWVIKLDDQGRCTEFTEWWMQHP